MATWRGWRSCGPPPAISSSPAAATPASSATPRCGLAISPQAGTSWRSICRRCSTSDCPASRSPAATSAASPTARQHARDFRQRHSHRKYHQLRVADPLDASGSLPARTATTTMATSRRSRSRTPTANRSRPTAANTSSCATACCRSTTTPFTNGPRAACL